MKVMGCIRAMQRRAQGTLEGKYRKFPMDVVNQAIENLPDKYCQHLEDVNVSQTIITYLLPVKSHCKILVEVQ